jgi:hypothetical protein
MCLNETHLGAKRAEESVWIGYKPIILILCNVEGGREKIGKFLNFLFFSAREGVDAPRIIEVMCGRLRYKLNMI